MLNGLPPPSCMQACCSPRGQSPVRHLSLEALSAGAAVDWIIQFDPPDDPREYIHRVGRTARGRSGKGRALLMLLPEELGFLTFLKARLNPHCPHPLCSLNPLLLPSNAAFAHDT